MHLKPYIGLLAVALLLAPSGVGAQWYGAWDEEGWEGSRRGSAYREYRERVDSLDDDIVEDLPIPVLVGVELRQLTKNFGDARDGGSRTHEGLDIMAPKGTPIASPTEAVVVRVGNGSGSGRYVRTANPGGESFVYMHLDQVAAGLSEGDKLERGDIIGFVGNTGNASGGPAHLHFEIRDSGDPQDPYPRLTEVFTAEERAEGLVAAGKVGGDEYDLPATPAAGNPATGSIVRDLELGMEGADVKVLQVFLNTHGYPVATSGVGSRGSETTYFGALTQKALARYQAANGITPAAGYYGPKTRAFVAKQQVI